MAGSPGSPVAGEWRSIARAGPLFPALGAVDWRAWEKAAAWLEARLPADPARPRRIHQLCVPLLLWIAGRAGRGQPRVVGLSGPQGCGKSTLAALLAPLLADQGLRAAAVSIDDFYLPRGAQLQLATAHPGNRYLEHRGYPGTHDLPLGVATLDALRTATADRSVRVPVYAKSAHDGRGDRLAERDWRSVQGPLDVVIVEGWLLGFQPVAEVQLANPSLWALRVVNRLLAGYEAWHARIDDLIVLQTSDLEDIVRWRAEAEAKRAASGESALDPAAAEDYIRRFLPAYALYGPGVVRGPWDRNHLLAIQLGPDRLPVARSGP